MCSIHPSIYPASSCSCQRSILQFIIIVIDIFEWLQWLNRGKRGGGSHWFALLSIYLCLKDLCDCWVSWHTATYPNIPHPIHPISCPFRGCESIWPCSRPPPDESRQWERWDPGTPACSAVAPRSICTPQMRWWRLDPHQISGVENRPCPKWAKETCTMWLTLIYYSSPVAFRLLRHRPRGKTSRPTMILSLDWCPIHFCRRPNVLKKNI